MEKQHKIALTNLENKIGDKDVGKITHITKNILVGTQQEGSIKSKVCKCQRHNKDR